MPNEFYLVNKREPILMCQHAIGKFFELVNFVLVQLSFTLLGLMPSNTEFSCDITSKSGKIP